MNIFCVQANKLTMIPQADLQCFGQCSLTLLCSTGGFVVHGQLILMQMKPQHSFILKNKAS